MTRQYETTHPWMTFALDLTALDHLTWMRLGEAVAACEHVQGVPLQPAVAQELHEIYLSKGAHATTEIEGNSLSEEQVLRRLRHDLPLPPSQQYLGQEVDNILAAYNLIADEVAAGTPLSMTPERIMMFNETVLQGLASDDGVRPGEIRTHSVLVGSHYRGAPAQDCEYLLHRLCDWLDRMRSDVPEHLHKPVAILSAVMAHLYLAWIHPFGDGNGRTARLMEFQILTQAGVPLPSAHLLSDFYNRTRAEYYRQLRHSSEPPYRIDRFVGYALEGFVDGLRGQLGAIREQQMRVTWTNFVHEAFHDRNTKAAHRQRRVLLSLPPNTVTPVARIPVLTPQLAAEYAGATRKMVTRDVNALVSLGLVARTSSGVVPRVDLIRAFLPVTAEA